MTDEPAAAVIVPAMGLPWDERALVARRLAGVLAARSRVDVLTAGSPPRSASAPGVPIRHRICRVGEESGEVGSASESVGDLVGRARYETIVLVGCEATTTREVLHSCSDETRVVLVPLADRSEDTLHALGGLDHPARVHRVLAVGPMEMERIAAAHPGELAARTRDVGFALRVHPLARRMPPRDARLPAIVVLLDAGGLPLENRPEWLDALPDLLDQLRVYLVRPGGSIEWLDCGDDEHRRAGLAAAPMDVWRWTASALAIIDSTRAAPLGRHTIEAMLLGIPVLTEAGSGAPAGHVQRSGGGIRFRSVAELHGAVLALHEEGRARDLGSRGRAYAEVRYGDPDGFVAKVRAALAA